MQPTRRSSLRGRRIDRQEADAQCLNRSPPSKCSSQPCSSRERELQAPLGREAPSLPCLPIGPALRQQGKASLWRCLLRIAQVSPLFESVPPTLYGGTERVVSYLTEALVELGHDVTLFASGDSVTRARLVPVVERSLRLDRATPGLAAWHTIMIDRVFGRPRSFDVIHFHIDYVQHFPHVAAARMPDHDARPTRPAGPCGVPAHFASSAWSRSPTASAAPLPGRTGTRRSITACRRPVPLSPRAAGLFRVRRPHLAREAPRPRHRDRHRVRRAAAHRRQGRRCRPSLLRHADPALLTIRWSSSSARSANAEKNEFIGNARALLFPIDWPEPFGLVMIEAMACGTPVIAYRCGSVPEVMEHGVTRLHRRRPGGRHRSGQGNRPDRPAQLPPGLRPAVHLADDGQALRRCLPLAAAADSGGRRPRRKGLVGVAAPDASIRGGGRCPPPGQPRCRKPTCCRQVGSCPTPGSRARARKRVNGREDPHRRAMSIPSLA